MKRIILRFSLNTDPGSVVRNAVAGLLQSAGFNNTGTGTWEATGTPSAMTAITTVLNTLTNPAQIPNANPSVTVDHIWFYLD